jgi:kynurenine formamidase
LRRSQGDLSHPLLDGQPVFPGDVPVSVTPSATIAESGFNTSKVVMTTHTGTHFDVPYHFYDDGKRLDQFPLDRFFGPACLIDLAPGGSLLPRQPITLDMFLPHEAVFQPGAKVFYRTGWDRMVGQPGYFADFPSLTVEAARWMASRRIGLLGMDTPSVEAEPPFPCHRILLDKGVETILLEGAANLGQVSAKFSLVGFPMPFAGRDGAPVRAVAMVE